LHLTEERGEVLAPEPEASTTTTSTQEESFVKVLAPAAPVAPTAPAVPAVVPPVVPAAPVVLQTPAPPAIPAPVGYGGGMTVRSVGSAYDLNAVTAAYEKLRKTQDMEFHGLDVILSFAGGFASLSLFMAARRRFNLEGADRQALAEDGSSWTA